MPASEGAPSSVDAPRHTILSVPASAFGFGKISAYRSVESVPFTLLTFSHTLFEPDWLNVTYTILSELVAGVPFSNFHSRLVGFRVLRSVNFNVLPIQPLSEKDWACGGGGGGAYTRQLGLVQVVVY